MWQISSGHQPFESIGYGIDITLAIYAGGREGVIDGTPIEYSNLYMKCWKQEPDERPDAQTLVSTLKSHYANSVSEKIEKYPQHTEINDISMISISGIIPTVYWHQMMSENGDKNAQYKLGKFYQYEIADEAKAFEWY
ncbi:unnamed protein product [Rhizophagus irregularis]|nr:unnamed protein product [Rhizophagus irregularis]